MGRSRPCTQKVGLRLYLRQRDLSNSAFFLLFLLFSGLLSMILFVYRDYQF